MTGNEVWLRKAELNAGVSRSKAYLFRHGDMCLCCVCVKHQCVCDVVLFLIIYYLLSV